MKIKKIPLCLSLAGILLFTGCGQPGGKVRLDPDHPATVTIWHYYNGAQKNALDSMVDEFNNTVGSDRGIIVECHNQGDIPTLESSVMASVNKEVGSDELPNIFSSYADTAYNIEKMGLLVNLDDYLTKKEQETYIDSYIEEGRIGSGGELKIFPTAKSTEIFMMNKTDWDKFSTATGISEDSLKTIEGVAETAKSYFEWTDSLTPEVKNDGKAFFGRDAVANLFVIGAKQLGCDIFQVENQKLTLNLDKDILKKIWDAYYVPYINGYFAAYGRFRSDDAKAGDIIALVGSTTTASYFPTRIVKENEEYPVEVMVLPAPVFEGGEPYAVQQGAGMVVTAGDKKKEYASVEFLKWFTEKERNMEFSCLSGYLPVKKDAVDLKLLDQTLSLDDKSGPLIKATMNTAFTSISNEMLYTCKAFSGSSDARKVLEYNLSDKAKADAEQVKTLLSEGMDREQAVSQFDNEANFEKWFTDFQSALEAATKEQ